MYDMVLAPQAASQTSTLLFLVFVEKAVHCSNKVVRESSQVWRNLENVRMEKITYDLVSTRMTLFLLQGILLRFSRIVFSRVSLFKSTETFGELLIMTEQRRAQWLREFIDL